MFFPIVKTRFQIQTWLVQLINNALYVRGDNDTLFREDSTFIVHCFCVVKKICLYIRKKHTHTSIWMIDVSYTSLFLGNGQQESTLDDSCPYSHAEGSHLAVKGCSDFDFHLHGRDGAQCVSR